MKYRIDTIRPLAVLLLLLVSACPAPLPAENTQLQWAQPLIEAAAPIPADWLENPTGGVVFDPVED